MSANFFKQVVSLDEQMRQTDDSPYQSILTRARSGTLTYNDMLTLNSKAITSLASPHLQNATAVTTHETQCSPTRHKPLSGRALCSSEAPENIYLPRASHPHKIFRPNESETSRR
jgi:hypothetical protein